MSYKLSTVASLAQQMAYAPRGKRLAQLAAAEELLLSIDPEKGYPVGFVVHAVTGYRPKHEDLAAFGDKFGDAAELLTGVALQHDLGVLVESVSDEAELSSLDPALGGEPVLDLSDVCRRFEVTSKTIQRWRRRGLPARRFVFPEDDGPGKKRIGFRLACVERFVANQEGSAERPAGIEPMTDAEQAEVARRAGLLAEAGHDRAEVVRRVARRTGRSPLAVLHTLKRHDALAPAAAVLPRAAGPLDKGQAATAAGRVEGGEAVAGVAASLGRRSSAVYRVLIESRAERLAAAPVKYHDDPLFHDDDPREAERQVEAIVRDAESSIRDAGERAAKPPRGLPPYLAELYRTPLLTPAMERALFLRFNFHKCRFATLRRALDPHLARRRDLVALERHLRLARETKNRITTANLRLVVSVARKHLRPDVDLMELVSDGNVVLMRAVEGFDIARGYKFSTYATLALVKGYARSVPQMQADRRKAATLAVDPAAEPAGDLTRIGDREELAVLLGHLDARERGVLATRWELPDRLADCDGATRRDLASLSKQRLRQIEQRAMIKLRGLVASAE